MTPPVDRHGPGTGETRDMADSGNEQLLFVDDEASILAVAAEFFEFRGYRVFTAGNGREAVAVLEKERIDCCFTDINMPEMDGLALAEYIYAHDNTLPVVIMTGHPSLDSSIQMLKKGVVDFLIKPVNLSQMELCLQRVLRERRLFIENILLKKEIKGKERLEQLNRELVARNEDLRVLNRIMDDFAAIRSSWLVFKRMVDMLREVTPADEARFYVINKVVENPFEIAASLADGIPAALGKAPRDGSGPAAADFCGPEAVAGLIRESVSEGMPILIPENRGRIGLPGAIRSLVIVPMTIRDAVFGVLVGCINRNGGVFSEKQLYYLTFMLQKAASAIENLALYENIYENLFATLYGFVKATEARDPYTQQHSNRVTGVAMAIAREMGCSAEDIDILHVAGQLHDIGKIGIRDAILLKPAKLSPEEYDTIREHPVIGASIVGQLGLWQREQTIIRYHHERFDGTGYPDGLKGTEIPFLARILSVADVYDAIGSDRAYRGKMDPEGVLKIIRSGAGSQFDPAVVDVFMRLYRENRVTG